MRHITAEDIWGFVIFSGTIIIAIVSYYVFIRVGTNHLLKKHQAEWDEKKAKIKEEHKDLNEMDLRYLIDGEYVKYLRFLMMTRGTFLGACFPFK